MCKLIPKILTFLSTRKKTIFFRKLFIYVNEETWDTEEHVVFWYNF